MAMSDKLEAVDRYQQEHRKTGIALATFKKFQEDQATSLASLRDGRSRPVQGMTKEDGS